MQTHYLFTVSLLLFLLPLTSQAFLWESMTEVEKKFGKSVKLKKAVRSMALSTPSKSLNLSTKVIVFLRIQITRELCQAFYSWSSHGQENQ